MLILIFEATFQNRLLIRSSFWGQSGERGSSRRTGYLSRFSHVACVAEIPDCPFRGLKLQRCWLRLNRLERGRDLLDQVVTKSRAPVIVLHPSIKCKAR